MTTVPVTVPVTVLYDNCTCDNCDLAWQLWHWNPEIIVVLFIDYYYLLWSYMDLALDRISIRMCQGVVYEYFLSVGAIL